MTEIFEEVFKNIFYFLFFFITPGTSAVFFIFTNNGSHQSLFFSVAHYSFYLNSFPFLFIIHLSYRCIVRTVNFTYDVDRQVLVTFQIPQLFKFKFFQISSILFVLTKKGAFNIVKKCKTREAHMLRAETTFLD